MAIERMKNLIIGSGESGKNLAWYLGQAGEQTVVVERRWIGGSCPNTNCLPSKNEIWGAKVANLIQHAGHFGIKIGPVSIDMAAVRQRKRNMVDHEIKLHLERYEATRVELIMGSAKFTAPKTVEIQLNDGGTRTMSGERIFLNLGTHALIPNTPGLADAKPLTHIEMLELDRVPEHLIVIGGGYVGLEFAQAYRRFGSRVTIIQHNSQLLVGQDEDVVAEISRILVADGIEIMTSAEIASVRGRSGALVDLVVRTAGGDMAVHGSDILVAAGRTPNTSGIGLDLVGIEVDSRGYLKVNEKLETTAPNVWAMGECAGSPQFTHVALDDFRIIRDNIAGGSRSTRDRVIPSCLFTDPQVAHIGLNEADAKRIGKAVRIAKIPVASVLRTHTNDETSGFLKAMIDPETDQILGFTMIGPEAGEVLAVVQTAMLAGLPFITLRDAVLAHPTMAEGLNVLFSSIKPNILRN
ncbi:MAG: FAD-dependent oxidoreductase [Tepidisphaeraceae bacterium]|jgi:pyruvate/2-oxoglutarate dehydrogenase complex dihydrolipoamide dehydrogenase (E3) component